MLWKSSFKIVQLFNNFFFFVHTAYLSFALQVHAEEKKIWKKLLWKIG